MAKKRRAAEALLAWRALDGESFLPPPGPGPLSKRPRSDDTDGRKKRKRPAEEDARRPSQEEEGEVKGKRRAVPQKAAAALPGLLLAENSPRRRQQQQQQLRVGGMDEEGAEGDVKNSRAPRPPEVPYFPVSIPTVVYALPSMLLGL